MNALAGVVANPIAARLVPIFKRIAEIAIAVDSALAATFTGSWE
jgi:hypothetical protein